jgi:hypothetical protein
MPKIGKPTRIATRRFSDTTDVFARWDGVTPEDVERIGAPLERHVRATYRPAEGSGTEVRIHPGFPPIGYIGHTPRWWAPSDPMRAFSIIGLAPSGVFEYWILCPTEQHIYYYATY